MPFERTTLKSKATHATSTKQYATNTPDASDVTAKTQGKEKSGSSVAYVACVGWETRLYVMRSPNKSSVSLA